MLQTPKLSPQTADIYYNDIYQCMLERNYRVVVCYGARDTGKSYFVGGQYIPIKMLNDPYFRGVGIRNTYVSLKDSVYAEISDGFNVMDEAFNFKLGELIKKTKSPLEISVPHKKIKCYLGAWTIL